MPILGENYLSASSTFTKRSGVPNLKSSSCSFEDMFDRMPKILGVTWGKLFMYPVGIPYAKLLTKFEAHFFKVCVIKVWNKLPPSIVVADSVTSFVRGLNSLSSDFYCV